MHLQFTKMISNDDSELAVLTLQRAWRSFLSHRNENLKVRRRISARPRQRRQLPEMKIFFVYYRNQDYYGDGEDMHSLVRARNPEEAKEMFKQEYPCFPEKELYSWFEIDEITSL